MENRKVEKECPWCTICLVIAAMTCHSLVLWGNCSFAASLGDIGQSTNGWANVGIDLSESLQDELDPIIATVSANLTQVIDKILEIKTNIDDAIFHIGDMADGATATGKAALLQAKGHSQRKRKQLPIGTTGQIEDLTWMMQTTEITRRANASALPDVPDVPDFNATATCQDTLVTIRQEVNKTAYDTMAKVSGLLEEFFLFIKPTLIQIGAWLITFGTKVQTTIEGFSKTLDVVQNYKLAFIPHSVEEFDLECLSQDMDEIFHQVVDENPQLTDEEHDAMADQKFLARYGHSCEDARRKLADKHQHEKG